MLLAFGALQISGWACTKYGQFVIAVKDLVSLNKNPYNISKDWATEDKRIFTTDDRKCVTVMG